MTDDKPPIPMRLCCEACGELHIDEGEFATKPHHTHSCQSCGLTWRPAIECTVGVQFLPGFRNASAAPSGAPTSEGLGSQRNDPIHPETLPERLRRRGWGSGCTPILNGSRWKHRFTGEIFVVSDTAVVARREDDVERVHVCATAEDQFRNTFEWVSNGEL